MTECVHILVKGRVQGVYFRDNTTKQARKLGLAGYVRNLPTGDVEVVAHGEPTAVQQLVAWCHKGPLLAKVTSVSVQPYAHPADFGSFEIR